MLTFHAAVIFKNTGNIIHIKVSSHFNNFESEGNKVPISCRIDVFWISQHETFRIIFCSFIKNLLQIFSVKKNLTF